MSFAPKPVLGTYVASATAAREQKLAPIGRAALLFCAGSAVLFVLMLLMIGVAISHRLVDPSDKRDNQSVGFLVVSWLLSQLVGLPLGLYTRRTKAGKVALITALAPDALAFLLLAGRTALEMLGRQAASR